MVKKEKRCDFLKRIDMHTHTHASDGTLSATTLINQAVKKGLGGISVTDHDTVDSLAEGRQASKAHKEFWFLPGIEFSTEINKTEVHLLGYGIDDTDESLLTLLKKLKESRDSRAQKMITKLADLGFTIDYEQVKNIVGDGVVGRLHIARALVDSGGVYSIQEAFEKYLKQGQPAYFPRFKLVPTEVISLIHRLSGVSVLAHPGLMKDDSLISDMLGAGLMGIEAYYPSHSDEETQRYLRLAHKEKLLVTGGSDFHAPTSTGIRSSEIGQCSVPIGPIYQYFDNL